MLKKIITIYIFIFSITLSANEELSIYTGFNINNHKIDNIIESSPLYSLGIQVNKYYTNYIIGIVFELGYSLYDYTYSLRHEYSLSSEINLGTRLNKYSNLYGIIGLKTVDYVIETKKYNYSYRSNGYGYGIGYNININKNLSITTDFKFYNLKIEDSKYIDYQKILGLKILYTF